MNARRAGPGLLIPSAALLWGLQFAFLNPALALILVELYGAGPAEVGLVLAIYNAGGLVASIALPAYADRRSAYVPVMLLCGVLTVGLAGMLAAATSLPVAVVALVVLGGPAGVGSSLLFAHLKHSGARPSDVVNTRALVSVAWVAGPPLATLVIGVFGNRAILLAIGIVAALNIATTAAMLGLRSSTRADRPAPPSGDGHPVTRWGVVVIVLAFVLLQATNSTVTSVMSLFVTRSLGLNVVRAGIALGVAAGLEIPALLLLGRLSGRFSNLGLLVFGCIAGIAYYAAAAAVRGPVLLLAVQLLNAWFVAVVTGVGLTLFQEVIPRPGLASGLYTNTRRLGAIASGPVIAVGGLTVLGYRGVFVVCAGLTGLGLGSVAVVRAGVRRHRRAAASTR